MAAQQGFIGRSASRLIGWLAVPRVITLPLLMAGGMAFGQLLWFFVDSPKIFAWLAGVASPFCVMCATAVWGMRDRMDSALDIDQMSSWQFQQYVDLVNRHRARSTGWAAATALMSLLASTPAISNQLVGPVWQWTVIGCAGAVAFSVYAYLLANYWEQQIRAYQNHEKIERKKRQESDELVKELCTPFRSTEVGWKDGPTLETPTATTH